jgi:hypothetical protein
MNTQNTNQQQLYGEPLFIEGTAGKKQVTGEPQFVTGKEKHAHQLSPLYADNDITTHGEHHEHSQKPEPEHVHLTIHTDDPSKINLEKLIHITPDGQIKVTPDEDRGRHTEHLQEPFHHEQKHHHSDQGHKHSEHLQEPFHHEERGTLKSKKASRSLSAERAKYRDEPTETTTIVKVGEHEPGTAGYKDGKSGSHYRTDSKDTHHRTDTTKDTHHRTDTTKDTHLKTDTTKVKVDRSHSDTEPVHVSKSEHLKAKKSGGKKKRFSDKARHRDDTSESTTVVKIGEGHHHGLEKQHSESYVKAGTLSKPHEHEHERDTHGRHLVQQIRDTLNDSENPNMDILGDLLMRAETLLAKSANQTNIDSEARKTLDDISTMLITAKQLERHKCIAERLQRISDECQKSLNTVRSSDTPSTVKNASKEAVDFVKIWRPVFQLLIRSRDFRQLIVDSLRIIRHVVTRNEGIMDDLTQKFIEGDSVRELKLTAKEHRDTNVNVKMTDREWEYLQEEIQGVLAVLARNSQYHDAINRLFTLLEMCSTNAKSALPSSESNRFELEIHARKAKMETEELVASFTGKEILKEFKFRLRRLAQAYNKDPEIRRYFSEVKSFILSSKSEEEVRSELYRQKTRDIINWGRHLIEKSKEKNELEQFLDTGNQLIENIKNDEYVKELRTRAGIVRSDLTYTDNEGRTKIDVDMLVKLQAALMPVLADTFQKIHIPRIEHSDPRLDFWVDNIVLCGYDIFPDNIKFHIEREMELSIRDIESRGSYTRLVIDLDKIRTEIKNIEFYFKKKTMPSLSDSGLVTFRIPENGAHLGIYFTIEDRPGETHPRLTEGYADFSIRKMDIEFDKSTLKHDVLLPMIINLAKPAIHSKIEKAVETNLSNALKQLGDRLTLALGEVNRPSFLGGRLGSVKETIKASYPVQVNAKRKVKLE